MVDTTEVHFCVELAPTKEDEVMIHESAGWCEIPFVWCAEKRWRGAK
jgi:hypothetical protein